MVSSIPQPEVPLEVVSDYELLRLLETETRAERLGLALDERDERLQTRAYSREFWTDVFNQETRKLRDNLGGEFVTVRTGAYLIGDHTAPLSTLRRVSIAEPFSIGRFPVTEGLFKRFVDAGGYADHTYWDELGWHWVESLSISGPWLWRRYPFEAGRARLPMCGITYFEATAFCRWRSGRETGAAEVRLPTSVEWQCAARGRLGRRYPWGSAKDPSRANIGGTRYQGRTPVTRYPGGVSPSGAWDMIGNVGELTSESRPEGRAHFERIARVATETPSHATLRRAYDAFPVAIRAHGGAMDTSWEGARTAAGSYRAPDQRVATMGFRVARTPAVE